MLILVAATAGVCVAAITPRYSRWPARPPQAELTIVDGAAARTWQAVSPLESAWRGDSYAAADPRRITGRWARIGRGHGSGKTILFLRIPRRPDQILLLQYHQLTPAGLPDGRPLRTQCSAASWCAQSRCYRHGVPGVCVVIDNVRYRDGAVVVVVRWPVSASVSLARTRKYEYASWGFVSRSRPGSRPGLPRARPGPHRASRPGLSRPRPERSPRGVNGRISGAPPAR